MAGVRPADSALRRWRGIGEAAKGMRVPGHYDQLSVFAGNSNPELAHEICAYIGIPLGRADVFKFSNDNTFVRINESVRENDVFVVQSFSDPDQ